jgi:oligosaccharide repeat unit polymerase
MVRQRERATGLGPNTAASTAIILFGLAFTSVTLPSDGAVDIFSAAAYGVGLSLSVASGIEATAGVRNLIRADLLMLWVLYGLTFMEFLFPQPGVDATVSAVDATGGTNAALLGFAGIAVGRHLVAWRSAPHHVPSSVFVDVRPGGIFMLFILASLLGYLYVFLAVNFDLFEVLRQMSLPRFYQSWSRGRYGQELYTYLVELGALIYLIPPVAGFIYARSKDYNLTQKVIVTVVLLFTIYFGFASGTRNVIATYVVTFFGAYFLNKSELKLSHILYQGVPAFILMSIATIYMLEFRQTGLGDFSFEKNSYDTLYIDHNMIVISKLTAVFPGLYDYLGFEIPFNALVHPIPRIIWPGKPEGLSVSVESALGADGATVTLASTFVGEAYISGGMLAVLVAGLAFGAAAEAWNRMGRTANAPFAQLLYASGLFCAMISVRSITWALVTMLPTLALWLYGKFWLNRHSRPCSAVAINAKKR